MCKNSTSKLTIMTRKNQFASEVVTEEKMKLEPHLYLNGYEGKMF